MWGCNCAYILFKNNSFFFNFQEKNKLTKLDKVSSVAVGWILRVLVQQDANIAGFGSEVVYLRFFNKITQTVLNNALLTKIVFSGNILLFIIKIILVI